jgi:hypothetical protein
MFLVFRRQGFKLLLMMAIFMLIRIWFVENSVNHVCYSIVVTW